VARLIYFSISINHECDWNLQDSKKFEKVPRAREKETETERAKARKEN
jgi:hypothetical protein